MKRESVPINLILLSDDNPRLDKSFGEDEAVSKMLLDQKEKLYELAIDICEYGFNPLDTIGVYKSDKYDGFYEVGEGNRRICALKMLINPERIRDINTGLYSKFKHLSDEFDAPNKVDVVIFNDESELKHWMEIRHMGEQGGKGLSRWNSVQKMRFQRSKTGSEALLDFWKWMIENEVLTLDEIKKVTKTNWKRVLRERYFPFLRIKFDGRYNVSKGDLPIFKERIKYIQKQLDGQTVAIVYDQEKIEEFYNNISNDLYGKSYNEIIEDEQQISLFCGSENNYSESDEGSNSNCYKNNYLSENEEATISTHNSETTKTTLDNTGRDIFNKCSTIIPYSYKIRSSNMRLNKIINELKRLNPDEYPNACGTLLRALFELSAKVFLEKETGNDCTSMEFMPAIKKAADLLRMNKRLSDDQHSSIIKDRDNLRSIFNGYMHNTDAYPNSMALKNFFKSHKLFIDECLK